MKPSLHFHVENRFGSWTVALTTVLLTAVVCLVFAPIPSGRAADGRDFAGFFDVTNATDLGNGTEQVTLAVQFFNYSGADIANATVTLQDSSTPPSDIAMYSGTISILDQSSVTLSANFTISQDEYALWQNGGSPSLRIDYQDLNNNPVRSPIELNQGPVE